MGNLNQHRQEAAIWREFVHAVQDKNWDTVSTIYDCNTEIIRTKTKCRYYNDAIIIAEKELI